MASFLSTVRGQTTAVATLKRALEAGRVHHAYLFDGADGVGKERAAFGVAQALVCERRHDEKGDACGECSACVRALPKSGETRPLHPDIVVLERGLYEPAQIGRRTPETQDISIDQIRTLVLARAAFAPHEGRAKVFIVRRADELSTSAANALLKTLEEPHDRTHFILLTSRSETLLPTILSRTQRVRFALLSEGLTRELLTANGVDATAAAQIAPLAGGSVAAGLTLADPKETEEREAFVSRALAAVDANDFGASLDLAEEAKKVKRGLEVRLHGLASRLAEQARATAGSADRRADVAAQRHRLVLQAIVDLDANASAQMVVESLMIRLRSA